MSKSSTVSFLAALALAGWMAHGAAFAQEEPGDPSSLRIGRHTVRSGDTLEGLSRHYSGSAERWRENWRLNPEIENPHLLTPGQRIRVLMAPRLPEDTARVTQVSRRVEEKPHPYPWDATGVDHLLRERDGLRTREDSSAEVLFADTSVLRITESSLVFLQQVGRQLQGVPTDEIEIVEGQADLEAEGAGPRAAAVDIVLGETRAAPRPGPDGALQTRARRPDQGGAQLMVYAGESKVAAAGREVDVGRGMGTNVPQGEPPAPPEKLLPAPALVAPAAGSAWDFAHPELAWEPVPGAVHYTVEICRDADCGALEQRVPEVAGRRWTPERLAVGRYFWRATAVAASGLDGYPSPTRPFTVTADRVDREAPTGTIAAGGRLIRRGQRLVLGPEASLSVETRDGDSGVAEIRYLLDGRAVPPVVWSGGWEAGPHTAAAEVVDRVGNPARLGPLPFLSDPDPPVLAFETGGPGLVSRHGQPDWQPEPRSRRQVRRLARRGTLLEWSADGRVWLPIELPVSKRGAWTANGDRVTAGRAHADRPQVFLRAVLAEDPFAPASPAHLRPGELLRLTAEDSGAGVDHLSFGLGREAGGGGFYLWFESTDLVGNQSTLRWPLAEGRPGR